MASNSLTVASDLRSLILYGLDNSARREFRDIVARALRPPALTEDVPAAVAADWHEEHGDNAAAAMLREMEALK